MIKGKVRVDVSKVPYVRGSIQNKAMRIALSKAAVPVKAAVVAAAPKDFGNLKSSIKIKSKYYAKSKTWAAIVGPSSSFSRMRKRPKKASPKKKNKTLAKIKKVVDKRLVSIKKAAKKTAANQASRLVRRLAGRKRKGLAVAGRRLADKIRGLGKTSPTPKTKPKKIVKRKRAWKGGKVRPARYAHLTQWGSAKVSGRHWLERALSRSKGQFSSILSKALGGEIKALLNR